MNEKFIFDDIICYLNATDFADKFEQHVILIKKALEEKERQDKILAILKEKRVNLQFISYKLLNCGYSIQEILEEYNAFSVLIDLTLEEITLIVEWIKETKLCNSYDNGRCNGTKDREECYCKGNVEDCTFYKED